MTARGLEQVGFGWRSFLAAPYWLGLLYRSPRRFNAQMERLPRGRQHAAGLALLLFGLAWALPVILLGQILVFGVLGLEPRGQLIVLGGPLSFHWPSIAWGIAGGMAAGITWGIAAGIAGGVAWGIAGSIAWGIAGGTASGIAWGIAGGAAWGIAGGIAEIIAVGLVAGIAWGIAAGIAWSIAVSIAVGVAVGIALPATATRSYYLLVHIWFVWPQLRPDWYPRHPVAWDALCGVPFPGLDRLLAAYAEREPETGAGEIARLIDSCDAQRGPALKARARLAARAAGREADLSRLDAAIASLPDGDRGFLRQVPEVRAKVGTIAALQRRLDEVSGQPLLSAPLAAQLRAEIAAFREQAAGFREPLASEFRAAAAQWLAVAERQLAATQATGGTPALS